MHRNDESDNGRESLIRKENHGIILTGYFEKITSAALKNDQVSIETLFRKDFFTIDVKMGFELGLITPAGYLEKQGNQQAVEFLIKNGADIDYIGFGAALRGDR